MIGPQLLVLGTAICILQQLSYSYGDAPTERHIFVKKPGDTHFTDLIKHHHVWFEGHTDNDKALMKSATHVAEHHPMNEVMTVISMGDNHVYILVFKVIPIIKKLPAEMTRTLREALRIQHYSLVIMKVVPKHIDTFIEETRKGLDPAGLNSSGDVGASS